VHLLLDRWTSARPGCKTLTDLLGSISVEVLLDRLGALAYAMHIETGHQDGTASIRRGLIFEHLMPLGGYKAVDLISYLSENAAVLISLGQDKDSDVFHFAHRSFQEYLAARHLLYRCRKDTSFVPLRELVQQSPQAWREPGRLIGDIVMDTAGIGEIWTLLEDLIGQSPYARLDPDIPSWWPLWLAAQIADDQNLFESNQPVVRRASQQTIANILRDGLVELVSTSAALPPIERALCGRVLSLLGDPRPGIGLIQTGEHAGLPDISWCDVAEGDIIYGSEEYEDEKPFGEISIAYAFRISRYAVTHVQFQAFIDSPDGYVREEWWAGLNQGALKEQRTGPRLAKWSYANHPRETVSWYEAMAFCAWLSSKLGYPVTLPTEEQWERAARGTGGLAYPYGNEHISENGNTRESEIWQTTAVGLYSRGASPYGAMDMSGNVWEWTLSEYESRKSDNFVSDVARVLRGGSWGLYSGNARAAYRLCRDPDFRSRNCGFRLVSPASSP
jgi:formylglycine-generating enzyme required for sulfatase activity